MDKILEKAIQEVADKYGVEFKDVEKVLVSPYKMMRETIQGLDIRGKTSDQCEGLKTNFAMPVLFKLFLNEYKLDMLNGGLQRNTDSANGDDEEDCD